MSRVDPWTIIRSRSQHFTEAEIERIRRGFRDNERIVSVAEEMQCSSRSISKYYGIFRGGPSPHYAPRKARPSVAKVKAAPAPAWTASDDLRLRDLVRQGARLSAIAARTKKPYAEIMAAMTRLGLFRAVPK